MSKFLITIEGLPLVSEEVIAKDHDQAKQIFKRRRGVYIKDSRLHAKIIKE